MANLNQPPATPRDNINNPARNTTVNDLDDESTTKSSAMVTGLFRDRESAERAFQTVAERGYGKDDVNLIMSDDTRSRNFADRGDEKIGNHAAEGAGIGGLIGGTVGAIAGAIAAIGTSLIIPGLGIVIAGPLAAGLAGAGAGGITGGLAGALIGWGIPEERAKEYESGIKNGGILMGVTPRNAEDAAYFEEEWKKLRGEQVYR
ncbi:MAG TPA: hypothetical protein VFF74_02655 [Methylophilaceae bacterium]|nr:hypothetical protein [Methylophilaceae bacterium]